MLYVIFIKRFKGSTATVKFIQIFDHLFDLLNSRNPFGKGYKSPLRMENQNIWLSFMEGAHDYIINLKDTQGKSKDSLLVPVRPGFDTHALRWRK